MDTAIAFDTHRFVKRLVDTGMAEQTAEVLAREHIHLLNTHLVTKQDLADTRASLEAQIADIHLKIAKTEANLEAQIADIHLKIAKTEAKLEARMAEIKASLEVSIANTQATIQESKADLIKWMVGLMVAMSAVTIGVITAVIRFSL